MADASRAETGARAEAEARAARTTKERDDLRRNLGEVTKNRNYLKVEKDRLRAENDRLRAENDRLNNQAVRCSVCLTRRPNQRWPGNCGHIFCEECLTSHQETCRKGRRVMLCPLCNCGLFGDANKLFAGGEEEGAC